jgi:hypothetical protein
MVGKGGSGGEPLAVSDSLRATGSRQRISGLRSDHAAGTWRQLPRSGCVQGFARAPDSRQRTRGARK